MSFDPNRKLSIELAARLLATILTCLLGNLFLFAQDVDAFDTVQIVSSLIYLVILFYASHLIGLNKKHRQELLSKMDHDFSNNPDLLD